MRRNAMCVIAILGLMLLHGALAAQDLGIM